MRIDPALQARIVEALAPRVRRRLDALMKDPPVVGEGDREVVLGSATVTLADVDVARSDDDLTCDCLLAPACAHRGVVAMTLPVAEAEEVEEVAEAGGAGDAETDAGGAAGAAGAEPGGAAGAASGASDTAGGTSGAARASAPAASAPHGGSYLSEAQRRTCACARTHLEEILQLGAPRVPATLRAALSADLHRARSHSLVTLERALTSVATSLAPDGAGAGPAGPAGGGRPGALGPGGVGWSVGGRTRPQTLPVSAPAARRVAVRAALLSLTRLERADAAGTVGAGELGEARRRFTEAGGLNLVSLFAEPVVAASGFAGVQVVLLAGDGTTRTLARIRPGELGSVASHYRAGEPWGGCSEPLEVLSRRRILVSGATVSADGRLGGGRGVRAAVMGAAPGWEDSRCQGVGLEVVRGPVSGGDRTGLDVDGRHLALTLAARRLGAGPATEMLGLARGTEVEVLVRPTAVGVEMLGLRTLQEDSLISIPPELEGVWWPGLDRVDRSWLAGEPPEPEQPEPGESGPAGTADGGAGGREEVPEDDWEVEVPSCLEVTARWAERVLEAGPSVLASKALERDAAWLVAAGAPFAAELLRSLATAARVGSRRFDGTWEADPHALAQAWLALAAY